MWYLQSSHFIFVFSIVNPLFRVPPIHGPPQCSLCQAQMVQAKRDTAYGEKPEAVKTHLRNMVIVLLGPSRIRLLQVPRNMAVEHDQE